MYVGKMIFAQLMDFLPTYEFNKCVDRYQGNYKVKNFTCYEQFLCMAFAQLTARESLRDIEACLRGLQSKAYHIGIRSRISRTTLAKANEVRDWRMYAEFAHILISRARKLYENDDFGIDLHYAVYALDTTMIDVSLSLFPWARYTRYAGSVKLHALLDLRGNIPSFIRITDGKTSDVSTLEYLTTEPGSFYIFDRGYYKFAALYAIHQTHAFYIIRATQQLRVRRLYSHAIKKEQGLRSDQTVVFIDRGSQKNYPDALRRIVYHDNENDRRLVFLTNNFDLDAVNICMLYRYRWRIELFFRWIKQHLHIKSFFGISPNAVKTQVWIAMSVYVLIAIIKKQLHIEHELYKILQILSLTLFEKSELYQLLTDTDNESVINNTHNQLQLF